MFHICESLTASTQGMSSMLRIILRALAYPSQTGSYWSSNMPLYALWAIMNIMLDAGAFSDA